MKTTASNRKIRQLLTAIKNETLVPNPAFQRRLVWKNKEKCSFLRTVLNEYPFPEIYIAAGGVDLDSGEGTELLVDGQQRITTLNQYFNHSSEIKLEDGLVAYSKLSDDEKRNFLEYDVVIRDLGSLSNADIRQVFQTINSTSYSLNAMEFNNSRFDGELKLVAEEIADDDFFKDHRIFSANEVRRMEDTKFVLGYLATAMSTYFNRDSEIEKFLETYNEEFPMAPSVRAETHKVFDFIDNCQFEARYRVWKHADIFTLMVEAHRVLAKEGLQLSHATAGEDLKAFYDSVESQPDSDADDDVASYRRAALQATNDRFNRIKRGQIIEKVLRT